MAGCTITHVSTTLLFEESDNQWLDAPDQSEGMSIPHCNVKQELTMTCLHVFSHRTLTQRNWRQLSQYSYRYDCTYVDIVDQ